MPSKTFLNLSEEKKERIISSAIKEFSRVPFEKTSINKIIKDAGISRGSFYMYFEDKYDLANHLFDITRKYIEEASKRIGISSSGKLDEFILKLHELLYQFYIQENYRKFIFNILSHYNRPDNPDIECIKKKRPIYREIDRIYNLIDKNQFENQDEKYIKDVIELSLNIFSSIVFKTFTLNLDKDESTNMLKNQLKILKLGYGRKE